MIILFANNMTHNNNMPSTKSSHQNGAIKGPSFGREKDYSSQMAMLTWIIFFWDRKLKVLAYVWFRSSWNLTKFEPIHLIQTNFILIFFSIYEILNQKYAEKQKHFIPKKIFSKPSQVLISKQPALFIDPIFSEGFGLADHWIAFGLGLCIQSIFVSFLGIISYH